MAVRDEVNTPHPLLLKGTLKLRRELPTPPLTPLNRTKARHDDLRTMPSQVIWHSIKVIEEPKVTIYPRVPVDEDERIATRGEVAAFEAAGLNKNLAGP